MCSTRASAAPRMAARAHAFEAGQDAFSEVRVDTQVAHEHEICTSMQMCVPKILLECACEPTFVSVLLRSALLPDPNEMRSETRPQASDRIMRRAVRG